MRQLILIFAFLFSFLACLLLPTIANAVPHVEVQKNQLHIHGVAQPQLYGAEVQYFRLRGGYGRNLPRTQVIALWNKALDRLVEAKMNAVSFYIPWDFHEYAPGKFDFTGTADEDGDGFADYPSRDLKTFLKLIHEHGITRIMIRPGPFINAEWGFLGFGAIPSWFHDQFPESHMHTPWGWRRPLIAYDDPHFLAATKLWFTALYEQVLKQEMGPASPIVFLQLDNETNFQWSSLEKTDYGPEAITRYQDFLRASYPDLTNLNQAHQRQWSNWTSIRPPEKAGANLGEDRDWYRFNDTSIFNYLKKIRTMWQDLGVKEPQVLFTLAESYNAPDDGLLPNYIYRNAKDLTGLMTVNLYPKTSESGDQPLLNLPFKADLDVKSATAANAAYYGKSEEWAMGPEIQGGWWKGIQVTPQARQQTFLTVLGHGLKSFFVYYFHEGHNWDIEWGLKKTQPIFEQLRKEWNLQTVPMSELKNEFWGELQARVDRLVVMGFDTRQLMQLGVHDKETLYFDAPLDAVAEPREHFNTLKLIGERVIEPFQNFLARSLEVTDDVAFIKDSTSHAPGPVSSIPSTVAQSTWAGGLLGLLMTSNINPKIAHTDLPLNFVAADTKLLVHIDTGLNAPSTVDSLREALARGQNVINFLASDVPCQLGIGPLENCQISIPTYLAPNTRTALTFFINSQGELRTGTEPDAHPVQIFETGPIFTYDLKTAKNCTAILFLNQHPAGYQCQTAGGIFIQIGALIFDDYNSDAYGKMTDTIERSQLIRALLGSSQVVPQLQWSDHAEKAVAFARKDPEQKMLWVTVKTGSLNRQSLQLKVSQKLIHEGLPPLGSHQQLEVIDILNQRSQKISLQQIMKSGFNVDLDENGSTVYVIRPIEITGRHSLK